MNWWENEQVLSMEEARAAFPGKKPSPSSISAYRRSGFRGIKLESFYSGIHPYTTKEAVSRFLGKINRPKHYEVESPVVKKAG